MEIIRYFLIAGLIANIIAVGLPAVTTMFIDQAIGSWIMNFVSVAWTALAAWAVYLLYCKRKLGVALTIICFIVQMFFYRKGVEFYGVNRGFMEFELTFGNRFEYLQINLTPLVFLFFAWGLWAKNMDNNSKYINQSNTHSDA